jgi:DNA-binding transcriptional ArsR family regulator
MTQRHGVARAFQALGDVQRLAIIDLLRDRPRPVGELAEVLPVSRPAVSRHLRILKEAGLVADVAVGTRRIYTLQEDGVSSLTGYLEGLWDDALRRFALAADNVEPPTADG